MPSQGPSTLRSILKRKNTRAISGRNRKGFPSRGRFAAFLVPVPVPLVVSLPDALACESVAACESILACRFATNGATNATNGDTAHFLVGSCGLDSKNLFCLFTSRMRCVLSVTLLMKSVQSSACNANDTISKMSCVPCPPCPPTEIYRRIGLMSRVFSAAIAATANSCG